MLRALAELNGDDALARARQDLHQADAEVLQALAHLEQVASLVGAWLPDTPVHFDLAELRGYRFHTGVVFAAFVPGHGQEIARGGRYDDIGKVFGRARPATGFSADLKTLIRLGAEPPHDEPQAILAPWSDDPEQRRQIEELRARGLRVIRALPGQQAGAREMGCRQVLARQNGGWVVVPA
jgi:ATP phosphoribosyltransferase regulatory subunit